MIILFLASQGTSMLFSTVAASISIPTSSVEGSVFTPSSAFLSLVFVLIALLTSVRASLVAQLVKNLPTIRDLGSVPWPGRSPGEGNGNPLQYSCLENPMDRGAWQAIVQGVARVGHDLATKPPPNHHQQPVRKNISWLFCFAFP